MVEDLWLVLPLRAVVFQTLLLLTSIAIESVVLQRLLNISRKTATEYSATLNLLSTFVGWLCFFVIEAITRRFLETQLIRYIFFDRFVSPNILSDLQNLLYFFAIRSFIILLDLTVELIGLDFLLNFFAEPTEEIKHLISSPEAKLTETKKNRYQKYREIKLNKIKFKAIFWANFSSSILITSLKLMIK
ncbi:filament integrity protein FraC [Aerosakkonemataceae cyanobacterium BLCC-F50]|uniref:Filament integrity protein FraC n=1 Tax=Floridaenema flaviceps BLCC-F50 TaxID=3153642 RepID=A0ABV4XJY3_9CYAN